MSNNCNNGIEQSWLKPLVASNNKAFKTNKLFREKL